MLSAEFVGLFVDGGLICNYQSSYLLYLLMDFVNACCIILIWLLMNFCFGVLLTGF